MDPLVGSSLIGAAGSLLGGLFGSKKEKPVYVVPDYQQIRDKAEAAGFNPLTALTFAPGSVGNYTYDNSMGEAIANAGLMLADGLDPEKAARVQQLELQNKELRDKLNAATLRPAGAGLYQGRVSYGPLPVQGGSDGRSVHLDVHSGAGNSVADGGFDPALRPLPASYLNDPRRQAEHKPASSTSGFMTVDNPFLPGAVHVPTLDGDEAVQWYDLPSLAIYGGLNAAFRGGQRARDFVETGSFNPPGFFESGGKAYALQPPNFYSGLRQIQDQRERYSEQDRREASKAARRYKLAKPDPKRTVFGVPYTSR